MLEFVGCEARLLLKHLILCREYPPAPYPGGGIGTYAHHVAHLLADSGEEVHVIAQRWNGAPEPITRSCDGRLAIHRISLDAPIRAGNGSVEREILQGLASSTCPTQTFSWEVARYAERLIEEEAIDLIEAQEWEAPLYFLQLRRMLGLGPQRQPPCVVHLHSPTQLIFEHNEWDKTLVDYLPLSRFEEFTIRAADSLICPSHYLARGVTRLFELEPDRVAVIRYPMGETPLLTREPKIWSRDAICYVGRLELRKGVVEWIDAAIRVASVHPKASFHFLGSDTSIDGGAGQSVQSYLRRRIPRPLRGRFHFHGIQTRNDLLNSLATFSISVVPSRWENLPFTCIEAMATGLPVLVSPNGGMAELIRDGESGWIASDGSATGLAEALVRALGTSAATRSAMGARAAESVRQICANDSVVSQHIEHKSKIVAAGAERSRRVPGYGHRSEQGRYSMGFVVVGTKDIDQTLASIASVRAQSEAAPLVLVLDATLREWTFAEANPQGRVIYAEDCSQAKAAECGFNGLLDLCPNLDSVTILDSDMRLAPSFATVCQQVLRSHCGVGVVSTWAWRVGAGRGLDTGPWPVLVQPGWEAVLPLGCAIRVEAVLAHRSNAGKTWSAVTYPEPLVSISETGRNRSKRRYSGMALIQNPSAVFALKWFIAAPLREKARWIGRILLRPKRIAGWMRWQSLRVTGRDMFELKTKRSGDH